MNKTDLSLDKLQPLGAGLDFASQLRQLFANSWLFKALDEQGQDLLIAHLALYRAESGQPLLLEGEVSSFMLIVVDGDVDVVKQSADGHSFSISRAGPGKILGEMSMMDGEPRFASCIALQRTTIAVLSRAAFDLLLDEHPRLGSQLLMQLIALLSQRLRQTSRQLIQQG